MTIEQRPELNRLVDSSYPITWAKRRRAFKLTLPLWIFILVCLTEMSLLRAWLTNRLAWDVVPQLVGGFIFLFIFLWGIIELQLWFYGRSKRTLRLKEKHLVASPAKHQTIRFKSASQFQFEPIAENPSLTKLSIFECFSKRAPLRRRFAIIIEDASQVRELIQVLEGKRQALNVDFKIVVLNQPALPPAVVSLTASAFSISLTGFYFLLHGLPLLGIALMPRTHEPNSNPNFDAGQVHKLGQFLASHFSSVEQIRLFYLVTGIILTLAGLALMFWRSRLPDGKTANEADGRN